MAFNERVLERRFGTRRTDEREPDAIEERDPVVIVGFGNFGAAAGIFLKSQGVGTTVLDHDSEQVELLRRLGLKAYYVNATRADLLETVGIEHASVFILALDGPEATARLARTAKANWPHLRIFARAIDWSDAAELCETGVDHVYREALDALEGLFADELRDTDLASDDGWDPTTLIEEFSVTPARTAGGG